MLPIDPNLDRPALAVAEELGERGKSVRQKINRAIQVVGLAKIVDFVTQAKASQGTLMVDNGKRPRTLGGCFFFLLREHLGDKMDQIQLPFKPRPKADPEEVQP
jgi:hypothetical protein